MKNEENEEKRVHRGYLRIIEDNLKSQSLESLGSVIIKTCHKSNIFLKLKDSEL